MIISPMGSTLRSWKRGISAMNAFVTSRLDVSGLVLSHYCGCSQLLVVLKVKRPPDWPLSLPVLPRSCWLHRPGDWWFWVGAFFG